MGSCGHEHTVARSCLLRERGLWRPGCAMLGKTQCSARGSPWVILSLRPNLEPLQTAPYGACPSVHGRIESLECPHVQLALLLNCSVRLQVDGTCKKHSKTANSIPSQSLCAEQLAVILHGHPFAFCCQYPPAHMSNAYGPLFLGSQPFVVQNCFSMLF